MGAEAGAGAGGGGAPSRLMKSGSGRATAAAAAAAAAGAEGRNFEIIPDRPSRRNSDNGSWEFSMLNGTLGMGSSGAVLQADSGSSLSGEFAGMLMSRTHSTGIGSGAIGTHSSGSTRRGGASGGRGSMGSSVRHVVGGDGAALWPSGLGQVAGIHGGEDEGLREGGEEEEEEEEEEDTVAWHSLEATPLIDTATGKKVRIRSSVMNWEEARKGTSKGKEL